MTIGKFISLISHLPPLRLAAAVAAAANPLPPRPPPEWILYIRTYQPGLSQGHNPPPPVCGRPEEFLVGRITRDNTHPSGGFSNLCPHVQSRGHGTKHPTHRKPTNVGQQATGYYLAVEW